MSNSVQIKFWGVRGSTPCANKHNMVFGGNTTCLQIEADIINDFLIVDCGTGFRNLGNHIVKHKHSPRGHIFITHPHWDHLQGFPFFKPFFNKEGWFSVYMPPQDFGGCREILQGHMSNTFFPVSIDMLSSELEFETFLPGKISFQKYSVEYMWARHTVNTAMYKFNIGGKVIIFAPDNEIPLAPDEHTEKFLKHFKEFIKGADVLIHDAQFDRQQHMERLGWGHSSWESVVEIAKDLDIKNLFLTHHDPDSDDVYLDRLNNKIKKDYGAYFESVSFAREGQKCVL